MEARDGTSLGIRSIDTRSSTAAQTAGHKKNREFFQVKQVESSNSALLNLAFYSFLIFILPIGIFFFGRWNSLSIWQGFC